MTYLDVRGVTATWQGSVVVRDVSFTLPHGSLVVLLGSDGVAKSALLQAVAGVVDAETGDIDLEGISLNGLRVSERVRRGLVLIDRVRSVFQELTVEENIRLVCGSSASVRDAFDMFPLLAPRRTVRARVLSGGEQKILAIARAIAAKPKVLLIDNLSGGLAPSMANDVWTRLRQLADSGRAVLVSEPVPASGDGFDREIWTLTDGMLVSASPAYHRSNACARPHA